MKRRFQPFLRILAAAAGVGAVASPASAAGGRSVAVLPLELKGRLTDVAEDTLSSRLIQALAGASFQVLAGDVVVQAIKVKSSNGRVCTTVDCNREMAERLDVQFLVAGTVDVKRKDYGMVLELLDGPSGKSLGKVEERCDLCGIREVGDKMDRLAKSLEGYTASASPAPARLSLESEPPGAMVTVDGDDKGTTPLTLRLPAGDRKVAFRRAGHNSAERTLKLDEGGRERFLITLAPTTAAGVVAPAGSTAAVGPWRAVGWTTLAVGAAAAVAGAVLLVAVDGEPLPPSECPSNSLMNGECSRVRDARLPGGLLLGAGAATAVLGGLTLYLSRAPDADAGDAHAQGLVVNARGVF